MVKESKTLMFLEALMLGLEIEICGSSYNMIGPEIIQTTQVTKAWIEKVNVSNMKFSDLMKLAGNMTTDEFMMMKGNMLVAKAFG